MASLLQNLLGGGVKPETQGRPAFMSDRDAAARDTVYRKPAAKKAASSGGKSGGKSGGGGNIPIPTPRPDTETPVLEDRYTRERAPDMSMATTSPSAITPPIETQSPSNQPGFVPGAGPSGVFTGAHRALLGAPWEDSPTISPALVAGPSSSILNPNQPGPMTRDGLAAAKAGVLQSLQPGTNFDPAHPIGTRYHMPAWHLPSWLGGTGG